MSSAIPHHLSEFPAELSGAHTQAMDLVLNFFILLGSLFRNILLIDSVPFLTCILVSIVPALLPFVHLALLLYDLLQCTVVRGAVLPYCVCVVS